MYMEGGGGTDPLPMVVWFFQVVWYTSKFWGGSVIFRTRVRVTLPGIGSDSSNSRSDQGSCFWSNLLAWWVRRETMEIRRVDPWKGAIPVKKIVDPIPIQTKSHPNKDVHLGFRVAPKVTLLSGGRGAWESSWVLAHTVITRNIFSELRRVARSVCPYNPIQYTIHTHNPWTGWWNSSILRSFGLVRRPSSCCKPCTIT